MSSRPRNRQRYGICQFETLFTVMWHFTCSFAPLALRHTRQAPTDKFDGVNSDVAPKLLNEKIVILCCSRLRNHSLLLASNEDLFFCLRRFT